MKKRFLSFIVVCTLVLFFLPYVTGLPFVKDYLAQSISKKVKFKVSAEKISWSWFPSPRFTIVESALQDQYFTANIKGLVLHLNPAGLFNDSLPVEKIEIDTPVIDIKSLDLTIPEGEKKAFSFPSIAIQITNGHLALPVDSFLKPLGNKLPPPEISAINLDLLSSASGILINGSFSSEFGSVTIAGITVTPPSDKSSGEYHWDLDFRLKDIDLSGLRKSLLLLLPEDEIVKLVCGDIVLGGRATTADYKFRGTTSEFEALDRMLISAFAENVRVHIPETGLTLENACGPIKIEGAVLTGQGLSANLRSSRCKNGKLELGLEENDLFKLDLDIDGDLSDLHPVMDSFTVSPELKTQLDGITGLRGNARLHLHLGDDLKDIRVKIYTDDISARFYHDLLKREITLKGGELSIASDLIDWKRLNGMIGTDSIKSTSGSLSFDKEIMIDIQSLDATLDTAGLFRDLMSRPQVSGKLSDVLKDIDGVVKIRDFTLSGPLENSDKMKYRFTASSEDLIFLSPLVGRQVTTRFTSLQVSEKTIFTDPFYANAQGQSLMLSGNLQHKQWERFTGLITLEGELLKTSRKWLKERNWIPAMVFPELPCRIEPLKLTLRENLINISARILHPDQGGRNILTEADVDILERKAIVNSLEITDNEQHALVTADYLESKDNRGFSADFKGTLSGEVLSKILESVNSMPESFITGDCRLISPLNPREQIQFSGKAKITGLTQQLPGGDKINIGNALITGKDDRAVLNIQGLEYLRSGEDDERVINKVGIPKLQGELSFFPEKKALLKIVSGDFCGSNISGSINLPGADYNLNLITDKGQTITSENLLSCLGITTSEITGKLSLNANLKGSGEQVDSGQIVFKAKKGVIKKDMMITRILSLIDVTELFSKNPIKQFKTKGYRYDTIDFDANVAGDRMTITKATIHGAGLNLYATGTINTETWMMDVAILASPFKMIDSIITNLPIVGGRVGGENKSIISVPISAKGPVADPEITMVPIEVKTTSEKILRTFVKIFNAPFALSQKLVSPNNKETN